MGTGKLFNVHLSRNDLSVLASCTDKHTINSDEIHTYGIQLFQMLNKMFHIYQINGNQMLSATLERICKKWRPHLHTL